MVAVHNAYSLVHFVNVSKHTKVYLTPLPPTGSGQTGLTHLTVQTMMVNDFCFPKLNFLWGVPHVDVCHQEIIFLTFLLTF